MGRTACTESQCLYKGNLYLYLKFCHPYCFTWLVREICARIGRWYWNWRYINHYLDEASRKMRNWEKILIYDLLHWPPFRSWPILRSYSLSWRQLDVCPSSECEQILVPSVGPSSVLPTSTRLRSQMMHFRNVRFFTQWHDRLKRQFCVCGRVCQIDNTLSWEKFLRNNLYFMPFGRLIRNTFIARTINWKSYAMRCLTL